jgi:hypothetical protein
MRKKGCKAAAVRNTASRRREEYTEHAVYNFGHVVVDAENWILSRMKNVDGQKRENNGDTIWCGGEIIRINGLEKNSSNHSACASKGKM